MSTIIEKTTEAATSKQFFVARFDKVSIHAAGLSAGEEISIFIVSGPSGASPSPTPIPLTDKTGTPVRLTSTVPVIGLPFSGTYYATKPITDIAVSVSID